MTLDKIKTLALDGDLFAVQALIERLEAAEEVITGHVNNALEFQKRNADLNTKLEAAERDAAKWHEYQSRKKVLADRGFGKAPMRNEAMKENKQ